MPAIKWSEGFMKKFLESVPYINNQLYPYRKRVTLVESAKELPSPLARLTTNKAFVKDFNKLVKKHFGGFVVGVTNTNSMEPFIDKGHLPIMMPFKEKKVLFRKMDLMEGDIIGFHRRLDNSPFVLHRIVEKRKDGSGVITRGDNTVFLDGFTENKDIKYFCGGVLW
jgi:hypothetical protein